MRSDEELKKSLQIDLEEGFRDLLQAYGGLVAHLLWNRLRDFRDVQDLFQEVFVRFFRKLEHDFQWNRPIRPFLAGIVRIVLLEHYARAARYELAATSLDNLDMEESPNDLEIPDHGDLTLAEEDELLRRCIQRLPEKYRQVYLLYHVDGLSQSEIAKQLNVARGTVHYPLNRPELRDKFRNCLKSGWFGEVNKQDNRHAGQ